MFNPLSELLFTHLSGRHSFHNLNHFGLVGIEPVSISEQKRPGGQKARSLVSVDEGMIPNNAVAVRRCEFEARRIRVRV